MSAEDIVKGTSFRLRSWPFCYKVISVRDNGYIHYRSTDNMASGGMPMTIFLDEAFSVNLPKSHIAKKFL